MYQPAKYSNHQYSFTDFNQSCGMQLDETNEWVRLADRIPWHKMEAKYAAMFPSHTGRPAIPFRMALGVRIIQKRKKLSDRAIVKELTENPYLQYFIGMESFSKEPPLKPTVLVSLRKRINADYLMEANDIILEIMAPTAEYELKSESGAAIEANRITDETENLSTEILDATCSPSNIKYPQDFELLNDAREKLEAMIDSIPKHTVCQLLLFRLHQFRFFLVEQSASG